MKATRKKLLVENDYDFFLFGIACQEKPYRLCWALNGQLKASFSKGKDVEIPEKGTTGTSRFPVFAYRNEEMLTDYRVILNKAEHRCLVPEFRHADYLLMVQGAPPASERHGLLKKIRDVSFVQTAFEIDPRTIRSKDHFIF